MEKPKKEKKIKPVKTGVKGMSDATKTFTGVIRQDSPDCITCFVSDPVKGFSITFPPHLLDKKMEKYGDRLRMPTV